MWEGGKVGECKKKKQKKLVGGFKGVIYYEYTLVCLPGRHSSRHLPMLGLVAEPTRKSVVPFLSIVHLLEHKIRGVKSHDEKGNKKAKEPKIMKRKI